MKWLGDEDIRVNLGNVICQCGPGGPGLGRRQDSLKLFSSCELRRPGDFYIQYRSDTTIQLFLVNQQITVELAEMWVGGGRDKRKSGLYCTVHFNTREKRLTELKVE